MNRKSNDRGVRKLTKMGKTSLGISLPIELIKKFGWRQGQKLTIKKTRGGLVIRDWKP
jgi:antitoxin component of MazEF toxin-antitoxin module